MRKLSNLGEIINKEEQQVITGGGYSAFYNKPKPILCAEDNSCPPGYCCVGGGVCIDDSTYNCR